MAASMSQSVPQAISFRVEGMAPQPQGSKRWVGNGVLIESCKLVKPWRYLVCQAAIATGAELIRGPLRMEVQFLFARPKGHYNAKGQLRPAAPAVHCVRPDGSKLLRSTEDALTGVLYDDDARIVSSSWEKRYCVGDERPGAIITLGPILTAQPI